MKKILMCAISATAAFAANAGYTALTFKTTGGNDHTIEIRDLAISFSDDNLTASNQATSISLPLSQVESMQFTDAAAVDTVSGDKFTEQTNVYDLNGRPMGCFASFTEAMGQLPGGVYLFRYADGSTLKIAKE